MAIFEPTRFEEELGKALADRLGLAHDTTLTEWSAKSVNQKSVIVKMETFRVLSIDEFNELSDVAAERAAVA